MSEKKLSQTPLQNENNIIYFKAIKGSRSGLNIGGITVISRINFLRSILGEDKYFERYMFLVDRIGNNLKTWGKSVNEEDLEYVFNGISDDFKGVILGHYECSYGFEYKLKKNIHLKYGKKFESREELMNAKISLLNILDEIHGKEND